MHNSVAGIFFETGGAFLRSRAKTKINFLLYNIWSQSRWGRCYVEPLELSSLRFTQMNLVISLCKTDSSLMKRREGGESWENWIEKRIDLAKKGKLDSYSKQTESISELTMDMYRFENKTWPQFEFSIQLSNEMQM